MRFWETKFGKKNIFSDDKTVITTEKNYKFRH